MAYKQKYFKEIKTDGVRWRLRIYQDTDESLTSMDIGPVLQGLTLKVQGDQAEIDSPIVKTSLEMTFADAPDLPDAPGCKNGYWEEFYTSSATEYKVELYKDKDKVWTGYVTPDSFSESLEYRGSVTLIARDNLGALQDFEYNAIDDGTGMISLIDLVTQALNVISFPMQLVSDFGEERRLPYTTIGDGSQTIKDILFNHSVFKEKTWLEALESVLLATGLTLRYVGDNIFALAQLRDLPLYGHETWEDVEVKETIFCAYGFRELSPAIKTLVDEVLFQIEEDIAESDMPIDAYGEEKSYDFYRFGNLGETVSITQQPIHAVVAGSWSPRTAETSLLLNPFKYLLKEGHASSKKGDLTDTSTVYVATNPSSILSGRSAEWKMEIGPGKYRFAFTIGTAVSLYDDHRKIGHSDFDYTFSRFAYNLRYISNDGTEKLEYRSSSNSWIKGTINDYNSLFPEVPLPVTYEFPDVEITTRGFFYLIIYYAGVDVTLNSPEGVSEGAYLPIKDIILEDANLVNMHIPDSQKTTTHYNNKNNIRLERSIDFGFNEADLASPKIIRNGMYIKSNDNWYISSDEWKYQDYEVAKPLPALLHQQLLPYYAKPNNVLTGELATADPTFNAHYLWNGKRHLIMSGALNIITGRMESVILREFYRYEQLWGVTTLDQNEFNISPLSQIVSVNASSKKILTVNNVQNIPGWISVSMIILDENSYQFNFNCEKNTRARSRTATLYIDTALLTITQQGTK